MRWEIANKAHRAELAITNLVSNKHKWNNCFIKFGTVVNFEIMAKFYWFLILQKDKLMWQEQQQLGGHRAYAPCVNLDE